MTLHEVLLPKFGLTEETANTIVVWHRQVGDHVDRGEVLFEVETDKTVMEVDASVSGVLREIKFAAGEEASPGDVVAVIEADSTG